MKEQAEKIWEDVMHLPARRGMEIIQSALEAAREEGIAETHKTLGGLLADVKVQAKAEGAEELRMKVLDELLRLCGSVSIATVKYFQQDEVYAMPSLAPPKPAVPGWFREWRNSPSTCGGTLTEQWEGYLAHAPKPDAGRLAEAALTAIGYHQNHWGSMKPQITAAIQAELEADNG